MYGRVTKPRGRSVIWRIAEHAELREERRVLVVRFAQVHNLPDGGVVVGPLGIIGCRIGHLRGDTGDIAIHSNIKIVARRCRIKGSVEV